MQPHAEIVEIFSSRQGEGPLQGEQMTFVRLGRCTLHCSFCDTPKGICYKGLCQVEAPPGSGKFREESNPVSVSSLCRLLESFDDDTLSITGGEPLEQVDFLLEWLPFESQKKKILLETNGVHHEALDKIIEHVHIIGMDFKLPSSSGIKPVWSSHVAFLKRAIASGRETYVKIVVTSETTDNDIQKAISILAGSNKFIPVIIQPASPTLTFNNPVSLDRLNALQRICGAYLPDVRIIPQIHKDWGVL